MRIANTGICHNTKKPKPVFSIDVCRTSIVTSSLDGEIRIWTRDGVQTKKIKKHAGAVLCVRFSISGHFFASGGDDGAVFVYRADGEVVASAAEHESDVSNVLWTNRFLISVGYDGQVVFYNLDRFAVVRKIRPHEGQIKGIAADRTFRHMCTQGEDGIVLYEDYEVARRIKASEGIILESFFSRMSWSPDGRFLASGLSFNTKYNTVEILNRELQSECSLLGHVAPCEVAMFSPNVYGDSRRHYILAVSSQDLSLSFWSSLSPRPFLLVKNLTELPVLDMRWSEDGSSLFVCSYGGEVKRIDVQGDFGDVFEEGQDPSNEIAFSIENMDLRQRDPEPEPEPARERQKKVVQPVLIDDGNKVELATAHSCVTMFRRDRVVQKSPTQTLLRTFGDYSIELNEDRRCISVSRGSHAFYQIHGLVDIVCVTKRHLCVYSGRIQIYHLRTGLLAIPFICTDEIASMDMLRQRLVYLHTDGLFTVFSLSRCRVQMQGRLPRCDGLVSLRLSRRFFLVAAFADGEYFFGRKAGVWFLKTPRHNDMSTRDTDIAVEHDETLNALENELLVMHTARKRGGVFRTARRIVNAVVRMKRTTDFVEMKLDSVFRTLLDMDARKSAVEMLECINANHVFQPFVFSILKKMGI